MLGTLLRLTVLVLLVGISSASFATDTTDGSWDEDSWSTDPTTTFERTWPSKERKKPHIFVILADDLGWNDVSFHGSNQIPTPNIDALAFNGIVLNSHYVAPMCTPSRSALMTGKYPIHTGMQHSVLIETEPRGLPLKEKMMPEFFRQAGYATHAIGKWHLGFFKHEYTPTYRGFDTHFGYWHGYQDYFTHEVVTTQDGFRGYDMRRNMSVAWDAKGKYSTDLFAEEAVRLIEDHDTEKPMFMYLSHLAPHSGNEEDPYQAPDEEIAKFPYIDDPERRTYAAMVSKLDASVGEVVAALRRRGMLDNSIILFMADNGAPTMGLHNNRGSNYPLRGIKDSPWEGASRAATALWSPLIKTPRRVSNQLISITDWLPTFWDAAGLDVNELGQIDGVSVWNAIVNDKPSPRSEVLINLDDTDHYAALRRGDFKYVTGHTGTGDGWYGDTGALGFNGSGISSADVYPDRVLTSKTAIAIGGLLTANHVRSLRERRFASFENHQGTNLPHTKMLSTEEVLRLRSESIVTCRVPRDQQVQCDPIKAPCLFNIKEDPCEELNLAPKRPIIMRILENALLKYRVTQIPAANIPGDPRANAANWGGVWVPWRDPNPMIYADGATNPLLLSGTTIAVIAVIVGLSIVAAMTLVAIKHSKCPNSFLQSEHVQLPTTGDEPVAMTRIVNDRRHSLRTKTDIEQIARLKPLKEVARSID